MAVSHYELLELKENATKDEVVKSYRRLSMIHHPDRPGGNKDKFQKISEAYEVLSSDEKRQTYDMSQNGSQMFSKMGGGTPVDEIFASMFAGMGGMGGLHGMQSMGGNGMPQVRIFHNSVPMQQSNVRFFAQKPPAIVKHISIPIVQILSGTTVPIEIERIISTRGEKSTEKETVYIKIPQGIDEGEVLVIPQKGNVLMANEEIKGDVKISIHIENDTAFTRKGLDLIYEKTITVKEALCGFSFELKYLTGKVYAITNGMGHILGNGYNKSIPNMGFERNGHTGNLIIVFTIRMPEKLSSDVLYALKKIEF